MPRRPAAPPPKDADWQPVKTYGALKKQLADLEQFRGRNFQEMNEKERGWTNLTENILIHGFGENSNNLSQFHSARWAGQHRIGMSSPEIQRNYEKRIKAFEAMLTSTLQELELMGAGDVQGSAIQKAVNMVSDSRNVFVVHGRDTAARESVARFLEKLELNAVVLHEQPNKGQTVIEKFEAHSDVGFAVVLLTPDDVGGLASGDALSPRARQNVILELGYFIGKLGRARVCALYKEGVEIPSDIHGIVYVPLDDAAAWRLKLAHEIRAAGIAIDLNKI